MPALLRNKTLTHLEQRIYQASQLDEGWPTYNQPLAFHLKGKLDLERIEKSLKLLIRCHPEFETKLLSLQKKDFSSVPQTQRFNKAIAFLETKSRELLSVDNPQMQACIALLGPREYLLFFNWHWISVDPPSIRLFLKRFSQLYNGRASIKPLQIKKIDVIKRSEKSLSFWQKSLEGANFLLELPKTSSLPNENIRRGDVVKAHLSSTITKRLKVFAKKEKAPLSQVLQSAFGAFLYRYTGQLDFVIGYSVDLRPKKLHDHLGVFTNTLPMRFQFSSEISFLGLLRQTRKWHREVQAHQNCPDEEIMKRVNIQDPHLRQPLFNVYFSMQTCSAKDLQISAAQSIKRIDLTTGTAKFDLSLLVIEKEKQISLSLEYPISLQDRKFIERMAENFQVFLQELITRPRQKIADLSLLSTKEMQRLIRLGPGPKPSYPRNKSVVKVFEEIAKKHPKNTALQFLQESLSYKELNRKSNQLARYLQKMGVKKQDFVGIYLQRSIDLFVGILGILKSGAIYVPIDASYPMERKAYMIKDTRLKVLITEKTFSKQFPQEKLHLLFLHETDLSSYPTSNLNLEIDPLDLAYVNYTSGTTGNPKGVQICHRSINRLVKNPNWISFSASDRFLQISNISFDALVHELWGALLNGARLCIYPQISLSPDELGRFIVEQKVTQIIFTARLFILMVEEAIEYLKKVRCICSVGDVMSAKHAKMAFNALPRCAIKNACGHTENTTHTTAYTIVDVKKIEYDVPIGRPIGHTTTYVLDRNHQLAAFGAYGELCTGGDGVAKGYLNRPELTAEKFIKDPFGKGHLYCTGDLVSYREDGNLLFHGRIDTQVKIRGFRIELNEVEEVIREFSNVSDAIVMVREDVPGDKRLVAYVESEEGGNLNTEELRRWISSKLPSFMVPSSFVILEKFPMTPNGKVDKKALKAPIVEEVLESTFKTDVEKTVGKIWSQVLHRKMVGRQDNFFKIGGDSIHAMQVVSQLKRHFHYDVSTAMLFQNPTLKDFAAIFDAQKPSQQEEMIPRRQSFSPIALSLNQESLWLIDKLTQHIKLQYMVLYAYRLKGKLNVKKLQQALEKIVSRHEILRTYFQEKEGADLQWVELESRDFFLQLSAKDEKEALKLLKEKLAQPMNLSQLPLFQVLLFKVHRDLHFLAIRVHHIIFDVLSYRNLFQEWITLYSSQMLPELPIQYGDYSLWQRQRIQNPDVQKQLDFWKNSLKDAKELLELPWDKPRPPVFLGKGMTETTYFSKELSADLKELSQRQGVTVYILLFAAFKALLYRYTGSEDLSVGTPFANRERHELEPLIGYFLQMFIVRSKLSRELSFLEFLTELNKSMFDCYKNGDIPLEMIVNALNPPRDPSFNPLFQVLFVYDTLTRTPLYFDQTKLEPIHYETYTTKFDLSLFVLEFEEGLECRIEYSTDLFEKGTIERMLSHFETLLQSIVSNPHEKIGFLPILPKKQYQLITQTWNETGYDYPHHLSVVALFEEMVKKYPHQEALRFQEKSISYQQLNEKANQLARHLQKLRVQKQDFVGVYLERSDDLVVVILGILKAGAVYMPIDASYPMERKLYMIEHTELKILLSHRSFVKQFPTQGLHVVCMDEESFSTDKTSNLNIQIDPLDLAYINYTSGSTGKPKGVQYTHLGIVRLLKDPTWMKIGKRDRILQISNISFDMLAAEVWGALLNGATLCIYPQKEFSPQELGQFLIREKVSHLYLTARLFVLMVEEGLEYLNHVRFFSSTGDVMSSHHAKLVFERFPSCQIVNAYGPTENHITTTYTIHSDTLLVPIGRPVQGTQAYILDLNFQPVPIGVHGELCVGGDGLARGYLKDPERTAEKFIPNPFGPGKLYRTGDLARYLPDGNIEYLERMDTQVKILGFRIELDEVEGAIRGYPKVSDCVALAKELTPNEKRLVAYIEIKEKQAFTIEEIRQYLATKLPKHSIPSYFVLMEKFPLTPNGKVDKRKLPLPTATLEQRVYDPPVTPTEKTLAQIWAELLRTAKVSRNDDFFHIGGHSILAMQLHSWAKKAFQMEIPVSLIFENSTLSKYASRIDHLRTRGISAAPASEAFALWRDAEVILDPSITAAGASSVTEDQYKRPKKIFLTGASGFVGAFFLKDLIEKTDAKIYCLVRAPSESEAKSRLINTLKKYLIWKPEYENRMVAIVGRLEEPLLGLKQELFQKLAKEMDSIFHIGAFVNHAMAYEQHKRANVFGTQEILRLASTKRLKPLHFISTVAVVEGIKTMPVPEDANIDQSRDISNGYVQSKWVGEKLILIARSRGIPCNVFRLPRVGGDTKIGSGPTGDFLWRLIQACLILHMAPKTGLYDDLTPVDYICESIRIISTKPDWINSQFHVISPYLLKYQEAFKFLHHIGYSFELTDFNTWKKNLVDRSLHTGDHRLQALASLLADQDFSQPIPILKLGSERFQAALKGSGLKCPRIDKKLFKKYVEYYISIGYLPCFNELKNEETGSLIHRCAS